MAAQLVPLVNGKAYEHADITCIMLGIPIIEITAIEYGYEREMLNVWSTGTEPTSRVYGLTKPEAKVTMTMAEVMNIVAAAPNGRLDLIPEFDIIVAFTDASLIPVVHKVKNCRFMNNKVTSATGDGAIEIELNLIISHVEYA